jgi:D-alanine-D-alanine ligase
MTQHIAVLKGGLSSEREVSLNSGKACADALRSKGYEVTEVDVGHDIAEVLTKLKPDVAFNALHGTYGEDGCIQGVLEFLRIPYTHSGVTASAVAMDKPLSKRLFETVGIPCAKSIETDGWKLLEGEVMPRPYVIKPLADGSSVDVFIVMDGDPYPPEPLKDKKDEMWMVEQYIPGAELTVGVFGTEALGVIEVRPKEGFYDYRNKYTAGMTEYIIPAPVDEAIRFAVKEYAVKAHRTLGCRGVTRSDFRFDNTEGGDGKIYILEINTHPGMTGTSLVPKMAGYAGTTFEDLVERLVKEARLDHA